MTKNADEVEVDRKTQRGSHVIRVPLVALRRADPGRDRTDDHALVGRARHGPAPQREERRRFLGAAAVDRRPDAVEPRARQPRRSCCENGDQFFPLLLRDIAAAKESVHVESYIWWKGAICDQLARRAGGEGEAGRRSAAARRRLRRPQDGQRAGEADARLRREARPLPSAPPRQPRPHQQSRPSQGDDHRRPHRLHRRIRVRRGVDRPRAGQGSLARRRPARRRSDRQPAAGAFCENWIEETGEIMAGEKYFPHLAAAGSTQAHLAYTSPTGGVSSVQVLYYLAIKAARHEIIIQNPVSAAGRRRAARRWPKRSSAASTSGSWCRRRRRPTARSCSTPAIIASDCCSKNGVKIFEYKKTLLHQKVIIVDGVWSCVGSTNFDRRALQLNDEVSMGVLDAATGVAAQGRLRTTT